jgi:hypothetical protein
MCVFLTSSFVLHASPISPSCLHPPNNTWR